MSAPRGLGLILLVVVVGLVVGSLLGELLGTLLRGWLQEVLTRGPTIGLTTPATLDFRFLSLTLGFSLKVNLVGLIGVVLAAVALRRL